MAGGAKSNQKPALVDARSSVVNSEVPLRPTGATAAAVTIEDRIAVAGEAKAGVGLPETAGSAQSRTNEMEAPAGAEKPGLPIPPGSTAGR
jgi:hypothetical protein